MAKTGYTIGWNGQTLTTEKKFWPTTKDMILLDVLGILNTRLPAHVKSHYALKMDDQQLMNFKTNILTNLDKFIEEIKVLEQLNTLRVDSPTLTTAKG